MDYFSDFFELDHLRGTSSVYVIKKLKGHFARRGIPEQLVTDNGPQFVSRDFLKFSKEWDFGHRTSSPYHSRSNGKVESAVKQAMMMMMMMMKQAKKILLKCSKTGSDAFFALLDHRNTPPASMQISPAQRLFSRRTRSLLPMTAALFKPSNSDEDVTHTKLHRRQQQQAKYYNRGARDLQPLEPGHTVRVEPWRAGRKERQKGVVKSRIDKRSYQVELPQGLLRRICVELRKSNEAPIKVEDDDVMEAHEQSSTETREQAPPDTRVETFDQPRDPLSSVPDAPKTPNPLQAPRRSTRVRQPPKRSTGLCAYLRTLSKELNFINMCLVICFGFTFCFSVKLFSYFSIKGRVL